MREVGFYWTLVFLPAGLACWLLDLDGVWLGVVLVPTIAVFLCGLIYSAGVILMAGATGPRPNGD